MNVASALALREGDRERLEALARSSSLAARAVIVLLAADGMANTEIARLVGMSRPTVLKWRQRYEIHGLTGLDDEPRPGRPTTIDEVDVLSETLADGGRPPVHLGVPHWSARLMADHLGISFASVARIWRKYEIRPQHVEGFAFSTDPELAARVDQVLGLHLSAQVRAIVIGVDGEPPIRSVDRGGSAGRHIAHRASSGASSLFRALEIAAGEYAARNCKPQENLDDFSDFLVKVSANHQGLRLRIVCDSSPAQQQPELAAWRANHPGFGVHCTAYRPWLTIAGTFFGIAIRQAIRRGSHAPVDDLEVALRTHVAVDGAANGFTWIGNAEQPAKFPTVNQLITH
jgi:DNA-binding CsgD family transcriptional regulator